MASVYEFYDVGGKTIGPISQSKKRSGWRKPKGARLKKYKVSHRDPDGTQRWETAAQVGIPPLEAPTQHEITTLGLCPGRGRTWVHLGLGLAQPS